MSVLHAPITSDVQTELPRVPAGVPAGVPIGIQTGTRNAGRVRNGIAMLVYSAGYPLLAAALWTGARNGDWFRASLLVALGVFTSFVGWALLHVAGDAHRGAAERGRQHQASCVYLALYNRAGAIIVLLGSYAIAATAQGWPTPQTFIGWFALVWIPLFASFAIPVERSSRSVDFDD
jgi:hypothetical protein